MTAIATYGLTHLQIAVRDLARSTRFYTELLGMTELRRIGARAVMLRTPGSHEVFTLNEVPERAGAAGGMAHFGFRLRAHVDADALQRAIVAAGGAVTEQGVRGAETYVFCTDPDGYEVELFFDPA
jgi:catechol 2,3-dioxygenase-like lactoylglutathione lyase family enzyme